MTMANNPPLTSMGTAPELGADVLCAVALALVVRLADAEEEARLVLSALAEDEPDADLEALAELFDAEAEADAEADADADADADAEAEAEPVDALPDAEADALAADERADETTLLRALDAVALPLGTEAVPVAPEMPKLLEKLMLVVGLLSSMISITYWKELTSDGMVKVAVPADA